MCGFKVGWARAEITPPGSVQLSGQFYERISERVHDPLYATALALEGGGEDGKQQALIISCDLVGVQAEIAGRLRKRLRDRVPDFDGRYLILNATHTHTGPYTSEKQGFAARMGDLLPAPVETELDVREDIMRPGAYQDFLLDRLEEAAVTSWSDRSRGGMSGVLEHAVVGHNRRVVYDDGTARMYGSTDTVNFRTLEGPSDSGLELLFFWDAGGEPTGVMINVACPSQVVEHKRYLSADFWHEVRRQLDGIFDKQFVVLPLCSAAGDQSPRDQVRGGRGEPSMRAEEGMIEIGRRISGAVARGFRRARENICREPVLRHEVKRVPLPLRTVGQAEVERARREYEAIVENLKPVEKLGAEGLRRLFEPVGILKRAREQEEDPFYDLELHVMRLGELALCTNPFELFIDYGLRIKARSRARQTFIVQKACDSQGYLPTERAIRGGSYSAPVASGTVGPRGGAILVDTTVGMINALWPREKGN